MSTRIYALSKQLKVETKTIFDILKKHGIEGKGSALASLADEEVELVKTELQKSTAKPAKAGTAFPETPFQRPAASSVGKKIPVIAPSRSKKDEAETDSIPEPESSVDEPVVAVPQVVEPEIETVEEPADVQEQPVVEKETTEPDVPEPSRFPTLPPPIGRIDLTSSTDVKGGGKRTSPLNAFLKKTPEPAPEPVDQTQQSPAAPITTGLSEPGHAAAVRRDDYRSPMRGVIGKIPNLDSRIKKGEGDKSTQGSSAKSTGPAIRLAPVPKAPATKQPKSKEPVPQKPDMKLPRELIRDATAGGSSKPLEEHIRKHEERQRLKEEERKAKDNKRPGKTAVKGTADTDDRGVKGRKKGGAFEAAPMVEDAKKKRRGPVRRNRSEMDEDGVVTPRQLRRQRNRGRAVSTAAPRKTDIVIQLPSTVKQFAEQTGLSVAAVIKKLLEMGTPLMINSHLDRESAELLSEAFELRVTIRDQVTLEDRLVTEMFEREDPPEMLRSRPPVVTVLGHVDHGKTTLLDHIMHLNVVSGEKGGITQHIRAYRVRMDGIGGEGGQDITFVDTPGHEAFTAMRARGANSTDIAVLVVAADDGVMPQTEEAISHAKAAGVPIIVALNKMDLPGVNPDKVIQELAANDLIPSEWGGDTEIVRCSGLTGEGIDKLLSTIQLVAEIHELKANPDRPALGVALESELQAGQGVVCKVLVQNGTLRAGDVILCGTAYGRVKAMHDTLDDKKVIEEATPSTPVNVIGLDVAPKAGSRFCVLDDISDARTIAEQRQAEEHKSELADVQSHVTLETLFQRISSSQSVQTLNVIIRADVRGSIEAIRKELGKLDHPEVKIKILQATVGGITEADVQLADASDAIIVGFNVVPDENARSMAEKKRIQIRRYDIIYKLTDDIKKALEGMLKPLEQVKELGRAVVQRVYTISRLGSIAGCRVISGTIERDSKIRIVRESRIIGEYPLDSLKREKDDAKEVREGYECGMKLKGFNDLKEGDVLEAYKIEEIARTF